eukprot:gene36690-49451_t
MYGALLSFQFVAAVGDANAEPQIVLDVPARATGLIKPGQKVVLKYDAFPFKTFGIQHGTITSISSSAVRAPASEGDSGLDPRPVSRQSLNDQRATFAHSISAVATTATDANGRPNRAFVTRTALTADESAALMPFEVALTMRNFAELEARLAHSEIISPAEMQARYLPLAAAHDRVERLKCRPAICRSP